ncbi:vitrin [Erinaceus europaeus]|uniref:Vitrin n=1 Tax=Erinaceus europaeus TaxID=9365 RepID=A0A1S3W8L5_ERIEU|nr:vitrin [Erinaceus europaeus]
MELLALAMKTSVIEMFFVLLVTGVYSNKEATKKSKRPKFIAPQLPCEVKAGRITNAEFVVQCPAGCGDPQFQVYGTHIYASYSSVCSAAIHSGVIDDDSGGKVLVRKVAGQPGYRGSLSNSVQSLSLPRWRESFIVSEGKPPKSGAYPEVLTFSSSKSPWEMVTAGKCSKASQKPPSPRTAARPATLLQVLGSTASTPHTAIPTLSLPEGSPSTNPGPPARSPRSQESGFVPKEEQSMPTLEPVSQGDPNCKVDLAFVIDGSSSIGKRRFRIQKQFLAAAAQALDVGPEGPLLGVVQYGDSPAIQFDLKTHTNSRDLQVAIEKMGQRGGASNTGQAISFITKSFFSEAKGNRGGAPNVAVVLVDGWPSDRLEEASRQAREAGINVFFITVEGAVGDEKQLLVESNFAGKAACRPTSFFQLAVPSWSGLARSLRPLLQRVCAAERLTCSRTCLNSADLGFVLDGSSSLGPSRFGTVLQLAANLSRHFEVSAAGTRVGAVQYTYEQRLEFGFQEHPSKAAVLSALRNVGYWSGGTSTGAAIRFALDTLFRASGPSRTKLLVLVTDGRSYDDIRGPAKAAHQQGVIVYAIGVAWASLDELRIIASPPAKDHVFFVEEFEHLHQVVPRVMENICAEFNMQPRN